MAMMRLGQYKVGKLLGEGAFGKVYKGKHVTTGGIVAIKRLKIENYRQLKSAQNELRPLFALQDKPHKHIVKFFQTEVMHNTLWLVLEYCPVGTLNDFLLGQPDMPVKLRLMKEIADAVSFLHSKHIVHRDLKPDNILLSGSHDNPVVKVADFGLAKVCGVVDGSLSQYYMNTHCGTKFFLAPEVFLAQGYKMYCDIFSMGVIFVAMVDMRRVGNTVVAFIKGKKGDIAPIGVALLNNPPSRLSAHLLTSLNNGQRKQLFLSMLNVNYRDRPKAADVFGRLNLIVGPSDKGRSDCGEMKGAKARSDTSRRQRAKAAPGGILETAREVSARRQLAEASWMQRAKVAREGSARRQRAEASRRQRAEAFQRQRSEALQRQRAKALQRQRAEALQRQRAEALQRQRAEALQRQRAEALQGQRAEALQRQRAEALQRQRAEALQRQRAEALQRQRAEALQRQRAEALQGQRAEALQRQRAEALQRQPAEALRRQRAETYGRKRAEYMNELSSTSSGSSAWYP
ncbi:STK35 [Branchiostoma lanceolatum]|uniref:STK35 protein n=1 Tax=Branchiostoma lanceolatum TaxID=7740 RepID=A0A8K0EKN0_BRALA|nr:STK35 [Branchiostoma lanceolatum]